MEEAPSTFHNQEQQGESKYLEEQQEQEWSWLAVITGGHFVC